MLLLSINSLSHLPNNYLYILYIKNPFKSKYNRPITQKKKNGKRQKKDEHPMTNKKESVINLISNPRNAN